MATADRLLDSGLLHTAAVTVPLSSLVWHPPLRFQTGISSAVWFPFNLLKTPFRESGPEERVGYLGLIAYVPYFWIFPSTLLGQEQTHLLLLKWILFYSVFLQS